MHIVANTNPALTVHLVHNPVADTLTHQPFVKGGDVEVYVTFEARRRMPGHEHGFVNITRHGEASCISSQCGATAWSAWWVKEDVYGTGTRTWVEEVEAEHRHAHDAIMAAQIAESMRITAERDLMLAVTEALMPAEIVTVVAHLDLDGPARNTTRRQGVPVPSMARGVVTSLDERRDRKRRNLTR